METIVIERIRQDPENGKPEILNITLEGKKQKRNILKKENGVPFKKSLRPVTRIKYHSEVKYGPPPVENKTVVNLKKDEDCQFFTIMSIRSNLEYAAIVKTDTGVCCYLPNVKLSKPGMYKFKMPVNGEKFEMFGKLKVYRVQIIEPLGM